MMKGQTSSNPRIDEALLELAQDFRGTLLSNETADKITMRILGGKTPAKPAPLEPDEIRATPGSPYEPGRFHRYAIEKLLFMKGCIPDHTVALRKLFRQILSNPEKPGVRHSYEALEA
jgi:hypothetical protein